MNKKFLIVLIASLFGYKLTQAYTWNVYNKTGQDIKVTLNVSGAKKTQEIKDKEVKEFKFTGAQAGLCLKNIFVNDKIIEESMKGGQTMGAIFSLGTSAAAVYCSSKYIIINKNILSKKGENFIWKFANKEEIELIKAEKAKAILKPIELKSK